MNDATEKPSDFFLNWGQSVIKFRWALLAVTIASTGLSGWLASTRVTTDMGVEAFTAKKSKQTQVLEDMRDEFGRDDVWIVAIEGDVFSAAYIRSLTELHQTLAALDLKLPSLGQRPVNQPRTSTSVDTLDTPNEKDGFEDDFDDDGQDGWGDEKGGTLFEDIISLVTIKEVRGTKTGLSIGKLIPNPVDTHQLTAIKERALRDPSIAGHIVDVKGRHSLVILRSQFLDQNDTSFVTGQIRAIVKRYVRPGFNAMLAGIPTLNSELTELSLGNMRRLFGFGIVLMLLLLAFLFRHAVGVFGPLAVVVIATVNTFGFMGVLDMPVTMLSTILPSFLICVGLGDSVHLLSVFRDTRGRGVNSKEAAIWAVGTTAKPIFFTSFTTMIGLLSFRLSSIEGIQDMGTAGAFGVASACLHSIVFLPIVLSFIKKGEMGARSLRARDRLDRFLLACNSASSVSGDDGFGPEPKIGRQRRRRTLALGAALGGAMIFMMCQLRVYHNPMSWLADEHPLSVSFKIMDTHMGGNANIDLLIDGPENSGMKDMALLHGLDRLETHMKTFVHPKHGQIIGPTSSVLSVVKSTQRALNGGRDEQYAIPSTPRGVSDSFFLFESQAPDQLRRLATNDLGRGRVSYRIKWLEANEYATVAAHLEEGIAKFLPKNAKAQPTGTAYTLLSTIGRLIIDLSTSFGFACILITLILIVQLRSLKMGLVAMVPNLAPIIFVMGFMGLVGIPIDLVTILIASIAIGIAVDDTIHLLHHFRIHFEEHQNVEDAIRNAFEHAGRAMVSTTVILCAGFLVFIFATIDNIMRFGLLIALTAVTAMFIDLVFTPALLRTVYGRQETRNVSD